MDRPLREYSRHRRETPGAPGDLHPAQRQVLLQQVKESYPRAGTTQRPRTAWWVSWGWPRWALSATALIVLGLGIRWSLHEPSAVPQQMASLSRESLDASTPQAATPPPPLAAPMADRAAPASDLGLAMKQEKPAARVMSAPTPAPAAPPDVATASPAPSGGRAQDVVMLGKQLATDNVGTPTPRFAALREARNDEARWTLEFAQVAGVEAGTETTSLAKSRSPELARRKRTEPVPVLKSFRFSSQDGQLDLQDADGSIYKGSILPVSVAEQAAQQAGKPSSAGSVVESLQGNALSSPATVAGLYRFQVQGSNRSLQQWVNVTGTLSNSLANTQAQTPLRAFRAPNPTDPNAAVSWEIESRVQLGTQAPSLLRARQIAPAPAAASPPPR